MTETQQTRKCDVAKVKIGDKWSRHSYGKVVSVIGLQIDVENEAGLKWSIGRSIFEKEFNIAGQHETTEYLSRTEMVEKIRASSRLAMIVHFRKKPEHRVLVDFVANLVNSGKQLTSRTLSKRLKTATAGEERTMVGRHYGTGDEFGRLHFVDMEKGGLKLVDPRTVDWAIIDNVEYKLK